MLAFGALAAALCASAAAADYPLPAPPAVSTAATRLDFWADHVDYSGGQSLMHLKGNVLIHESTWTLKGDELWLDTERRTGRSQGFLLVSNGASAVYGDRADFDFMSHEGTLGHASAGFGDWRIHARAARLGPGRRLDYYSANFTSCDFTAPHYHFHAGRVRVRPGQSLWATNALFYVGPVPLFYTPVLYKDLSPAPGLRLKIQPGYDRRNGLMLKGTYLQRLSPALYNKIYLDYYSRQGAGVGTELERRAADGRGMLYLYRVREVSSGTERWTALGGGYQNVVSSFSAQYRLQIQSDPNFNNDYARSNLFRVTPELVNNAALVYHRPEVTARLAYSSVEDALNGGAKYFKTAESAPRLEAQTAPLRLGRLPWLNTFNGFADNSYDKTRPFLQKSVGLGWQGTRAIPLGRRVSYTPLVGLSQTYFDRFDAPADFFSTATYRDAFIGRTTLQNGLRLPSPIGDVDVIHAYVRRLKPGSFADDAGAPDKGVERNLLTVTDGLRPTRQVFVRASTGYDFRTFRYQTLSARQRIQPIAGDVFYAPRTTLNLTLHDDYDIVAGNRDVIANVVWGNLLGTYLGGGAGYNHSEADQYYSDVEFGYSPSTAAWRVTAQLRSVTLSEHGISGLGRFHLFEKEIGFSKNWHDFYTRGMIRFRPGGVREFTARLELRFGKMGDRQIQHRDWEAEWFPERAHGLVDRP